MITITRKLEFDAGHRLLKHEGKCRNVHGHRYVAEVTVSAPELDAVGRVVDFGVLKARVGGWIEEHWDHGILLEGCDPLFDHPAIQALGKFWECDAPPTAENMARWLGEACLNMLDGTPLHVMGVRIYETPNCWADWAPGSYVP